jgi:hypothetical protein
LPDVCEGARDEVKVVGNTRRDGDSLEFIRIDPKTSAFRHAPQQTRGSPQPPNVTNAQPPSLKPFNGQIQNGYEFTG